jgi:regulator of nonsense transcripts 1
MNNDIILFLLFLKKIKMSLEEEKIMTQFTNNAIVAGNLVADAKVVDTTSTLKDGTPFKILEATIALNSGGENTPPSFVTVQLVGYVAKRVIDAGKHLKGSSLGVIGMLVDEKFNTDDGRTLSRVKLRGEDVMFGDKFLSNFNSVTLYGHVAADPTFGQKGEVKHARMSIGNSVYNAHKKERESSFFNLVAFNGRAEFMNKYFHKGDAVMVQGRIHTSKHEATQPDGSTKTHYNTDIIVSEITFAQRKVVADNVENQGQVQGIDGVLQQHEQNQQPQPQFQQQPVQQQQPQFQQQQQYQQQPQPQPQVAQGYVDATAQQNQYQQPQPQYQQPQGFVPGGTFAMGGVPIDISDEELPF